MKKSVKEESDLAKQNLKAIDAKDLKVKDDFKKTIKALDKMTKTGLMKKNTAGRKKSRLQKKINALK